jgi:hypothetical protein
MTNFRQTTTKNDNFNAPKTHFHDKTAFPFQFCVRICQFQVEIVNALRPGDVLGSVANILNAVANRIGGVVGASPIGGGSFTGGSFGSGLFGSGSLGGGSIGGGSISNVVSPVSSVGGGVSPVVETGSSSVDSGLVSGIADVPNDPVDDNVIRKIGREYWSLFT